MRWLDSITKLNEHEFEQLWGTVEDRGAWHAAVHEIAELDTNDKFGIHKSLERECRLVVARG